MQIKKIYIIVPVILLFIVLFSAFCFSKSNRINVPEKYEIKELPKICNDIKLGGFSDLYYKDGFFYTITDRGPCTKKVKLPDGKGKVFPCKNYKPKIVKFKIENNEAKIVSINDITNVTGLPIAKKRDCIPLDKNEKILPFDINGLDSESLIVDNEGNYWVGDEYYPSIAKIDKNFKVTKRFAPFDCKYQNPNITYNLPEELNKIKKNKGFEAIAYNGQDKIYVFTQAISKILDYVVVLEFNIKTEQVENVFEYIPYDEKEYISGAVYKDGKIITVGKIQDKNIINIFEIKQDKLIKKSTVELSKFIAPAKFEGIAYNENENSFYIINDNDFGIKKEEETKSYIINFDFKD